MSRVVLLLLAVLFALVSCGCTNQGQSYNGPVTLAPPGPAIVALESLPVKGRAPMTGYTREQFGPAWTDNNLAAGGHNGCDTRNDILKRDLEPETLADDGCTVESGSLADPYTGRVIQYQRGRATSSAIQIDHIVALGDAWQKGAQGLDKDTRVSLANDPLNLFAVDGPTNQAKGDGDAATWLPPNTAFRCVYVGHQISVKVKYRLWITDAEKQAMAGILSTCPDQPTYS